MLGLNTTKQLVAGTNESFGDEPVAFIVPWIGLAPTLPMPLLSSLADRDYGPKRSLAASRAADT